MGIRNMVSDGELGVVEVIFPINQRVCSKKSSRMVRVLKGWLLFIGVIAVCTFAFTKYAPQKAAQLWKVITGSKAVVTGIMYDGEKPLAIVSGRIVHEGDIIDGCEVRKIHPDKVEFSRGVTQMIEPVKTKSALFGAVIR